MRRTPFIFLVLILTPQFAVTEEPPFPVSPEMILFLEGAGAGVLSAILWNSVPIWSILKRGAFDKALRAPSVTNWGDLRQPLKMLKDLITDNLEWIKFEGFALHMPACQKYLQFCECMQNCDSWEHWRDWSVIEMAHAVSGMAASRNLDFVAASKSLFVDRVRPCHTAPCPHLIFISGAIV